MSTDDVTADAAVRDRDESARGGCQERADRQRMLSVRPSE